MMQKKTRFYLTLYALLVWFSSAYASDILEGQDNPPVKKVKRVKLPLSLPNNLDNNVTLQNSGAPISSPRRGPIEVLSSPRYKPGESPRDWDKPLGGTPRSEDQEKVPGKSFGLRKKSSAVRMTVQQETEASAVASPRAPKTPRQDFTKPPEEKFKQGLELERKEKFKESLKAYKESFALGFEKASQKIGRIAYDLGIIQMAKEQKGSSDNVKFEQLSKRYFEIIELFETAEKHKFEPARDKLIEIFQILGKSAQKDSYYQQARHFFIMGAERDDIMCLLKLGKLISIKRLEDPFETYRWTAEKCYKRAALHGSRKGQVKYAQWAEQQVEKGKSKKFKVRLLYEAILFYEMAVAQGYILDDQKAEDYRLKKIRIEKLFSSGLELFKKKDYSPSLSSLKIAARNGHLGAKLLRAQIYEKLGNVEKAKKIYEELSALDDPEAMCSLARLNEEKDIDKAKTWLEQAIYLKHPMAYFDLGILYTRYARQLETEESNVNAARYFHEAILCYESFLNYARREEENGRPVNRQYKAGANFNLSILYKWNGRIGEEREYTKASAELEHPQGMYNYGVFLEKEERKMEAKEYFRKAAGKGLPEAQVEMGNIESEQGNIVEAAKWYQQAKFNNYPGIESILKTFLQEQLEKHLSGLDGKDKDASFVLGVLYKIQENPKQAKKCLKISAQKGHVRAAFELGLLYEEERNIQKALIWQDKGAICEGRALAHWGCLLYINHLSSEDKVKALKAIEAAINKGYLEGYQELALQLEAIGKKEKAEFFYQKDKELREKLASSHP